eukprot:TRINITY_DN3833_c3_g1_i4.p2 TRINITY_DN3833_c3_g1~~TRINITY_DN3833_c3_g1_i4.p2  ORF type:complete len:227 (-),score=25.73 TRINITY_DN3833_c3_g1_i4:562-1242(-)
MFMVDRVLMKPMRYHVGGTMMAVGLAAAKGWAVNIGGGMHHASSNDGMGWCAYSDIILGIRKLRRESGGQFSKVMIIDCDVHQGNGLERDKVYFKDENLFILDAYNAMIWPGDYEAKQAIDIAVEYRSRTTDEEYLSKLRNALKYAKQKFTPDIIIYNAGTDILVGDPLGRMNVSKEGVCKRDEMVWRFALEQQIPICMVLSGGYAKDSANAIACSLKNILTLIQQ